MTIDQSEARRWATRRLKNPLNALLGMRKKGQTND